MTYNAYKRRMNTPSNILVTWWPFWANLLGRSCRHKTTWGQAERYLSWASLGMSTITILYALR